mmetsp:Transcript_3850/g.5681  ORF Transcript_3850/g.5681 Transcript_3850/m.5681 type:complete len:121 (+) Transcript_3850:1358-1720(+)
MNWKSQLGRWIVFLTCGQSLCRSNITPTRCGAVCSSGTRKNRSWLRRRCFIDNAPAESVDKNNFCKSVKEDSGEDMLSIGKRKVFLVANKDRTIALDQVQAKQKQNCKCLETFNNQPIKN